MAEHSLPRGELLKNEPLAKYTSWRIGGPARQLYIPVDKADLVAFIAGLPADEKTYWIGLGSNLLVGDAGFSGTVIYTRGRLKEMRLIDAERVYVEAGVPCAHVARFCSEQGLVGAEFLAGIPGTMGGALKMNAGAFGAETWSIVDRVEMIDAAGKVIERNPNQFQVSYRSVLGQEHEWFLAAHLKLVKGDVETSQQQIKMLLEKRNTSQPTNKP